MKKLFVSAFAVLALALAVAPVPGYEKQHSNNVLHDKQPCHVDPTQIYCAGQQTPTS